jgi:hypothetical protein
MCEPTVVTRDADVMSMASNTCAIAPGPSAPHPPLGGRTSGLLPGRTQAGTEEPCWWASCIGTAALVTARTGGGLGACCFGASGTFEFFGRHGGTAGQCRRGHHHHHHRQREREPADIIGLECLVEHHDAEHRTHDRLGHRQRRQRGGQCASLKRRLLPHRAPREPGARGARPEDAGAVRNPCTRRPSVPRHTRPHSPGQRGAGRRSPAAARADRRADREPCRSSRHRKRLAACLYRVAELRQQVVALRVQGRRRVVGQRSGVRRDHRVGRRGGRSAQGERASRGRSGPRMRASPHRRPTGIPA